MARVLWQNFWHLHKTVEVPAAAQDHTGQVSRPAGAQCGLSKKQCVQKVWSQAVANWGDSFQDWPTVLPLLVSKKLHSGWIYLINISAWEPVRLIIWTRRSLSMQQYGAGLTTAGLTGRTGIATHWVIKLVGARSVQFGAFCRRRAEFNLPIYNVNWCCTKLSKSFERLVNI